MAGIDYWLFGYRDIRIDPDDLSAVTSLLLRASLSSRINWDGTIRIKERDFTKIRDLLSGRINYEVSEQRGAFAFWIKRRYKALTVFSVVFSLILTLFLSELVWDIRVEGNEEITDASIIYSLSECGFSIGDVWRLVDLSAVENRLLKECDDLAWVNVNRRGTVAYVKVIEKEGEDKEETPVPFYSNVVATTDCVIEEITVKSGVAVVKVGDAVKKGDVLIMGILPEEFGGGFCRAEGQIKGRVSDEVSLFVAREYEKSLLSGKKLYSCALNIFKISINIFKLYGNLTDECDIIENEISYSLLNKHKLPLSVSLTYIPEYDNVAMTYDDKQIVKVALTRLDFQLSELLSDADLIKASTSGEFTDEGYSVSSHVVYSCEVGVEASFDLE